MLHLMHTWVKEMMFDRPFFFYGSLFAISSSFEVVPEAKKSWAALKAAGLAADFRANRLLLLSEYVHLSIHGHTHINIYAFNRHLYHTSLLYYLLFAHYVIILSFTWVFSKLNAGNRSIFTDPFRFSKSLFSLVFGDWDSLSCRLQIRRIFLKTLAHVKSDAVVARPRLHPSVAVKAFLLLMSSRPIIDAF